MCTHEGKKRELIKVGVELFAAKGYDGVSIRDIAKNAGVSEAALYKHFKGKEDMALSIFSAIMNEYSAGLLKIEEQQKNAIDKLCEIIEFTYDLYHSHPAEIHFALLSQYCFWKKLPSERKPHFLLKAVFEKGMADNEIPKQDTYFWVMIYSGLMLQPLAQYPYFRDLLPEIEVIKKEVIIVVRKLFA